MILITGATGNVGQELSAALAARGVPARAVVREPARANLPAGIDAVQGDLELPESLTPALDGARAVFLLGGWSDMPGILRRIENAGVEHVVLLTSRCVIGGREDNPVTRMWLDSEAAVRRSGVAWTFLHPSGYQSNALRWLPQLRHGDVVRAPCPDVAVAAIDPADIALVAATVLTQPGHHEGGYGLRSKAAGRANEWEVAGRSSGFVSRWRGVIVAELDLPGPWSQLGIVQQVLYQRRAPADTGPVVVPQRGDQPRPVRREHQVGQRALPEGPSIARAP